MIDLNEFFSVKQKKKRRPTKERPLIHPEAAGALYALPCRPLPIDSLSISEKAAVRPVRPDLRQPKDRLSRLLWRSGSRWPAHIRPNPSRVDRVHLNITVHFRCDQPCQAVEGKLRQLISACSGIVHFAHRAIFRRNIHNPPISLSSHKRKKEMNDIISAEEVRGHLISFQIR